MLVEGGGLAVGFLSAIDGGGPEAGGYGGKPFAGGAWDVETSSGGQAE